MPDRSLQTRVHLALALGVLSLGACVQKSEPFIPASSFAESFAPFEVLPAVAQQEGLTPSIRGRGSSCTKGSGGPAGGPTITSVACRGEVEVRSREDAAHLTRAVFQELERRVEAHDPQGQSGKAGTPESGELHLRYCSDDTRREGQQGGPTFHSCMFLHFLAVERQENADRRAITYYFTLDEERSAPPAVKVTEAR